MAVMSPDDPTVLAMKQRNIPMTGENYQMMQRAMQTQGANGMNAPMSAKQMRDARGMMPNAKPNDWFDDEPEVVDNSAEEVAEEPTNADTDYYEHDMNYAKDASEMQYMDELAGDGVVTAKTSVPNKLVNKNVVASNSDVLAPLPENTNAVLPSVDASTGANENSGGGLIAALLATLAGGVGVKALMGNRGNSNVGTTAANNIPALREPSVESLNNQRQLSGPAELKQVGRNELKQLPAPDTIYQGAGDELKQLPKPRHRVQAGSSRDEAVSAITKRGKKLNAARAAARRL